ncbi:hypothetical protein H101_06267, partial [Trichophyton interdigitale H6]
MFYVLVTKAHPCGRNRNIHVPATKSTSRRDLHATKSSQRVIEAIDHYRCSHGPPSSLVRPADIVVVCSREILTMGRVLYKRALKLSLDWAVHRNLWRGQAVYIRSLFEANKHVRNPHDQR